MLFILKNIKLWVASFFKRKKKTKKESATKKPIATYHAKKRLEQRHGTVLTDHMIESFICDIKNKQAKFLEDTRGDTQAWIVSYNDKKYRVIYDYKNEIIITIYSSLKRKKIKTSKKRRKKIQKRLNIYDATYKPKKPKIKKPYKRNKKVEYEKAY